jgi:ribonucleoside-diphosphate reductase alpha chain
MEAVCYQAYWASAELAEGAGAYSSFRGSLWDKGMLPHESLDPGRRPGRLPGNQPGRPPRLGAPCKAHIARHGMRNSNCVAIAPTATISNIIGVSASIEPAYQNLYVKSNLSGEFTVVNEALVRDLKALGLWDPR